MKLNKRRSEGLWEVGQVEIFFKVWLTLLQCGFKRAGPRALFFIFYFSIKTVSPSYPGVSRADSQAGFNWLQSESYFCIPIDRFPKFCFLSTFCWICRCKKTTSESKVTRGVSAARQLAPLTSTFFKSTVSSLKVLHWLWSTSIAGKQTGDCSVSYSLRGDALVSV